MKRRRFVSLLAAGVPAAAAARSLGPSPPPLPRVNGGIVVQPLRLLENAPGAPLIDPALVDLQLRAVYALGFEQLRVTLPFARFAADFFAPIPYVRAARALGIDVVGVMSDFTGYALAQALVNARSRPAVLNTYRDIFVLPEIAPVPGIDRPGSFALEVLNEPIHALGLQADEYVNAYLDPVHAFFKLRSPELLIVSAAEIGNVEGLYRERALLEAGLEAHCDRVAYHVYSTELLPRLAGLARKPVWITESGSAPTESHLAWVRDVFPELRRRIEGVERVFLYVLFDRDPGRFRLLDIARSAAGLPQARAESQALVDWLAARVAEAAAGQPAAAYDDLIPDVTAYFPTAFDFARTEEASPFLPPT